MLTQNQTLEIVHQKLIKKLIILVPIRELIAKQIAVLIAMQEVKQNSLV